MNILDFFKREYNIQTFVYVNKKGKAVNKVSNRVYSLGMYCVKAFSKKQARKILLNEIHPLKVYFNGREMNINKDLVHTN